MNNGIRVFLKNPDIEKILLREAEAEHISPGEYISMVLTEVLSKKEPVVEEESEEEPPEEKVTTSGRDKKNQSVITLYGNDSIMLKQKAAEIGLSPTAYIRRIIYTKEFVNIQVYTDDLEDFMQTFGELKRGVLTTISFINRNSKEVFVQDVETIKLYLERIKDLVGKQVKMSYASRLKVERAMTKSIKEQINSLRG